MRRKGKRETREGHFSGETKEEDESVEEREMATSRRKKNEMK